MNPLIFCFFRATIIAVGMLPLPIIIDWRFQFSTQPNDRNGFCSQSPLIRLIQAKVPDRNNFLLLALCGILFMVNQILFIIGLSLTNATIAGVTQPFAAIFTCILTILVKQEPKSALKIIGVIIAVIGSVFMLIVSGLSKEKNQQKTSNGIFGMTFTITGALGCLCLLANTLCFAGYFIIQKVLLNRGIPPITITAWSAFFGWFIALFPSLYFLPSFHITNVGYMGWIGVLYGGLVHGVISFSISMYAARYTTPTVVGIYETLAPLFAIIFTYIFLNETTTWFIAIGALLIMLGVMIVIAARYREEMKRKKEDSPLQDMDQNIEGNDNRESKDSFIDSIEKDDTTTEAESIEICTKSVIDDEEITTS